MTKTTIADTRVRVRPSKTLLDLIEQQQESISEIPENLMKVLKANGYNIATKIEVLKSVATIRKPKIDLKLLCAVKGKFESERAKLPLQGEYEAKDEDFQKALPDIRARKSEGAKRPLPGEYKAKDEDFQQQESGKYLFLSDLRWLNTWLMQLRKEKGMDLFLHNLIENCSLELPKNEIIKRDPELEARCQRLRELQQNQEYMSMTKNIDARLKHIPEDTIAYQVKAINSQMIAVLQFLFSVVAGFVFGFLGLELIFGGLEFGLRLVLGIFCALVIGVAEMYFLLKKLDKEDKAILSVKKSTEPVDKGKNTTKPHTE